MRLGPQYGFDGVKKWVGCRVIRRGRAEILKGVWLFKIWEGRLGVVIRVDRDEVGCVEE